MVSKISIVKVSSIKPNPRNSEVYDIKGLKFEDGINELASSIKESGLLEPLVVNKKDVLISGHRRLLCLQRLGIEKCEVIKKDIKDEMITLIGYNRQRIKTPDEIKREILILEPILKSQTKMGKTKEGDSPSGSVRKQLSKKLGKSESTIQRYKTEMDRTEIELSEIKKRNPKLYEEVKDKPYQVIKKAHNEIKADINMVKEFKGVGTKKVKKGFRKDFNILLDRYKPSVQELYVLMKEYKSFTLDNELRKLLD